MADVNAAKALADGWTQGDIDAENARRRSALAESSKIIEPSFGEKVGEFAKDVVTTPVDMFSGLKRSLESSGRGLRQAAASVAPGLVDPEAARMAQQKAEEEETKNPPSTTSDVWKTVGDVAPWMIGGATMLPAGIAKGASLFPRAAKAAEMIPKALRPYLGGAAGGAAQAPFNPTSGDYDLGDKMETGALWGAGTAPLGYVAGKLYAPFRNAGASATAKGNATILNEAGLPKQLPSTQTNDGTVQAMTNALEQIPWLGSWVKKARSENAGWLTKKATEGTGKAVTDLTPSEREEMFNRLNAEGNAFRTSKKIDMTDVSDAANLAQQRVHDYAATTAKLGKEKPLAAAASELAPLPGNPAAAQRAATGMPYPNLPAIATTRTANDVMNLRNAASELAYNEKDPVLKSQYAVYKKSLEDKLREVHGTDRFNTWLKQWGEMEDVSRAAGKGGEFLRDGKLTPERLAMNLDDSFRPGSEMDKLVAAARGNMPSPPPGTNRALLTSLLLGGGSVLGGGTISKLAGGDFSTGAAIPATLGASLAAGLSRKAPTPAQIDMIRRMTMAGLLAKNPFE